MRALDIGEQRLKALEVVGYSSSEFPGALALMEAAMEMGEKARVTICTEELPTKENLDLIHLGMLAEGCHLSKPTARLVQGIPTTEFVLRKGSPQWQIIIPILVPLFTIGLIAFGITKLETISKALMPIILVSGGLLIILAVTLRKPVEKYIERGGKVPYLPATKNPAELEQKVKSLWTKACEWEKIPPESKFVMFSDDNPFVKDYNEAVGKLLRFKQFQTGRWQPAIISKSKKALAVR